MKPKTQGVENLPSQGGRLLVVVFSGEEGHEQRRTWSMEWKTRQELTDLIEVVGCKAWLYMTGWTTAQQKKVLARLADKDPGVEL